MMEQYSENNAEQGYRAAEIAATSVGRTLREARERLGLSVADMANQTKFATRQIDALEADNFQQLQGATFLRGFVRSYAKILHLDAQPLLEQLPPDKPVPQQLTPASVEMPFPAMLTSRRQNLIWSGAAFLLAVIVVGFGLWHTSSPRTPSEITQEPSKMERIETPVPLPAEMKIISDLPVPEESVAPPETAQSPVQETKTPAAQAAPQIQSKKSARQSEPANAGAAPKISALRLVFGDESWTEIKDGDGKILSSQINQPGSELRLEGHPPFSMLIGRALSVRLYQDDEPVDLTPYVNRHSEVAHLTLE